MGEIAHIPIKGALRSNSFHENNTIYNLPPMSPTAPRRGHKGRGGRHKYI